MTNVPIFLKSHSIFAQIFDRKAKVYTITDFFFNVVLIWTSR